MADLDRLPAVDRDDVTDDLRTLAERPTGAPPRVKRLKGVGNPLYRLRSGDYRVLYRIDEAVVTVMRVINRRDLERTLRRLRG
jgi:mRNA-degrading endonuclease RelE of RelBE toxin-antitoxin system